MKGQKVRVIVLTLANGETEVLITSLFDREKFTLEDISKAYVLRWQIEECYKRLKVGAELENFSGINLEYKNFGRTWSCAIYYCFICVMHKDLGTRIKLLFKFFSFIWCNEAYQVLVGNCSPKDFQALFDRASIRAKVKIRPGQPQQGTKRHHVFRRVC